MGHELAVIPKFLSLHQGLFHVQAIVMLQPGPQTIIVVGGLTHHFAALCTAAFIIGGFQYSIDP
ncbi:hypothetical protein DIRU0_D21946 [Diutina rugosa]